MKCDQRGHNEKTRTCRHPPFRNSKLDSEASPPKGAPALFSQPTIFLPIAQIPSAVCFFARSEYFPLSTYPV